MLEADDSERACIPAKLQLANFCQLRKAEIGQKQPFKCVQKTERDCGRSQVAVVGQKRSIAGMYEKSANFCAVGEMGKALAR